MRISYCVSDLCSSDLRTARSPYTSASRPITRAGAVRIRSDSKQAANATRKLLATILIRSGWLLSRRARTTARWAWAIPLVLTTIRSEEHTSELQSLMRISYAVFCLKQKKQTSEHKATEHTY